MAASVRSGARRLAGSGLLQRAPAAGGLLQAKAAAGALSQRAQDSGPSPARFMCSTMRHTRGEAPATLSQAMEEIQVHKEELYDLLAEARLTDRSNRRLLKALSKQIKPRPNDYRWCWTRAMEFTEELKPIIPLTGSLLVILAICDQEVTKTVANEKRRRQAEAAAKEE